MIAGVRCPPELLAAAETATPKLAIVLGSGFGTLADQVDPDIVLPFESCPPLQPTSVDGHAGRIILGDWHGTRVLLFAGRNHAYEGHPWECVLGPVALTARLKVKRLLLTNAAGGIRADLLPGCLMLLSQHLDLTLPQPWKAQLDPTPYDAALRQQVILAAQRAGFILKQGAYAAMLGPNYETPAEIRALRRLGVDAVGMSTAREASRAAEVGIACAAISCITNRAAGLSSARLSHEEVLHMARQQSGRLAGLLAELLGILRIQSNPGP